MFHQRMRECLECFETFYTAEIAYTDLKSLIRRERDPEISRREESLFQVLLLAARRRGYITCEELSSIAESATLKSEEVEVLMNQLTALHVELIDDEEFKGVLLPAINESPSAVDLLIRAANSLNKRDRRTLQNALELIFAT